LICVCVLLARPQRCWITLGEIEVIFLLLHPMLGPPLFLDRALISDYKNANFVSESLGHWGWKWEWKRELINTMQFKAKRISVMNLLNFFLIYYSHASAYNASHKTTLSLRLSHRIRSGSESRYESSTNRCVSQIDHFN
jgi:hypothetical protein